jgi:5'(3')-deoxyribonucleotidase
VSKKIIAIDIDEVLFPFMDAFRVHYNKTYGTHFSQDDLQSYDLAKELGISVQEAVDRVYNFHRSDDNKLVGPLLAARAAIKKLGRVYDLEIVSSRLPQLSSITASQLDKYFPGCFGGITSIGYAAVLEKPRTKAEVCLELNAFALIDDQLHHLAPAAERGIKAILFGNYSWNQTDKLPAGVTRCRDWPTVLKYFNV